MADRIRKGSGGRACTPGYSFRRVSGLDAIGGSTGSSLAFVCAVKGYPLRIVSSDAFAIEKIKTMEAFGAEVEFIASPEGITPDVIPAMMRRTAACFLGTVGALRSRLPVLHRVVVEPAESAVLSGRPAAK